MFQSVCRLTRCRSVEELMSRVVVSGNRCGRRRGQLPKRDIRRGMGWSEVEKLVHGWHSGLGADQRLSAASADPMFLHTAFLGRLWTSDSEIKNRELDHVHMKRRTAGTEMRHKILCNDAC